MGMPVFEMRPHLRFVRKPETTDRSTNRSHGETRCVSMKLSVTGALRVALRLPLVILQQGIATTASTFELTAFFRAITVRALRSAMMSQ